MEQIKNKKSTRKRKPHSPETRARIAKANTGKVFSEERKRNIGLAGLKKIPEKDLERIKELWELHYVPEKWIRKEFNLSYKVYTRYKKEHCTHEQIKFLPQDLTPDDFQKIINFCKNEIPCVTIAEKMSLKKKKVYGVIKKLSKFYDIKSHIKSTHTITPEHRKKLSKHITKYNKENPKSREKNPNWKGGISPFTAIIREIPFYQTWRKTVIDRDKWTCLHCSSRQRLQVDHIIPFSFLLKESRATTIEEAKAYKPLWDTKNGRTSCFDCHKKTDTFGGRGVQAFSMKKYTTDKEITRK